MGADRERADAFFRQLAEPLLSGGEVTKGTMMGFPCLRVGGAFFASADHRTGDLIVKLPEERVRELIAAGLGKPFAPAGRTFREWVTVPGRDAARWESLLQEARVFVESRA